MILKISEISKFKVNPCNIYFAFSCLYMLQGSLYSEGIIDAFLLIIIIFWSLIVGGRYLLFLKNEPLFIKATSLLLWMYIIYGGIYMLFPLTNLPLFVHPRGYLQGGLKSLLPILVFYSYAKNGKLSVRNFRKYTYVLLWIGIVNFYYNRNLILIDALTDDQEITNNIGYVFLSIMPIIIFTIKQRFGYILLALDLFFIYISFKRGAIMLGTVCLIYFLFGFYKSKKTRTEKNKTLILIILIMMFGFYYSYNLYENSQYLQVRVEKTLEGDSSGRDRIGNRILEEYNKNTITQYLIGRGANATVIPGGNFAHHDWLEIIYNNGIIGVFLLFLFYFSLFKAIIKIKRNCKNTLMIISFQILFFIIFMKTFFSMSILNLGASLTIILGYIAYLDKINTINKNFDHNKFKNEENYLHCLTR